MSIENLFLAMLAAPVGGVLYGSLNLMIERRILQSMPPSMTPGQILRIVASRGILGLVLAIFQVAPFYLMAMDGPTAQEAQRMALATAAEFRSAATERHQINLLTSREEAQENELKSARDAAGVKSPLLIQAEDEARACVHALDNTIRPAIQRRLQINGASVTQANENLQRQGLSEKAKASIINQASDKTTIGLDWKSWGMQWRT